MDGIPVELNNKIYHDLDLLSLSRLHLCCRPQRDLDIGIQRNLSQALNRLSLQKALIDESIQFFALTEPFLTIYTPANMALVRKRVQQNPLRKPQYGSTPWAYQYVHSHSRRQPRKGY